MWLESVRRHASLSSTGVIHPLALLAAPAFGAIELTPDNFDKEVLQSGKAAFIKFLAPW